MPYGIGDQAETCAQLFSLENWIGKQDFHIQEWRLLHEESIFDRT